MTAAWHGYLLEKENLPAPRCVVDSEALARKDCKTGVKAAEYEDHPEVLERKAEVLISMWTAAERPLVYTGAGISTASGIRDYASSAKGSRVQQGAQRLTHDFIRSLKPTIAHRVLTEMEKQGLVWGWLQQNHDGLAQKAGFPTSKVNEIHGSWLDTQHNPIIAMSGGLRGDLFEWMLGMEKQCDFVFACGTSFSGLNADRCADTCASRHMGKKAGQGLAVLSIQKTTKDDVCALRIFSKIDQFMTILARKLGTIKMPLPTTVHRYEAPKQPTKTLSSGVWVPERKQKRAAYESLWGKPQLPPPNTNNNAAVTSRQNNAAAIVPVTTLAQPAVAIPPKQPSTLNLRLGNSHRLVNRSSENNMHGWRMQLLTDSVGMVRSVTFKLHPTFSPSELTISSPSQDGKLEVFELPERCGWGAFSVGVTVNTTDGRVLKYDHELSFDGEGAFQDFLDV